jgi:hypothetical protein
MKEDSVSGNGTIVGRGKKSFLHRYKKMILIILSILILIVVSCCVGYLVWQSKEDESSGVCSNSVLEQAGKKISSNNTNQLVSTVKQIQSTPGHDTDSSCLYILTKYYIDITDADNAQKYYKLLVKAYNPELGYNSALGAGTLSPDQLESQVEFVKQLTENAPSASLENQVQQ